MNIFKFQNKQKINYTLLSIITGIMGIMVISNLQLDVNKYFIYFVISIASFCSTLLSIRKASVEIEEILIQEEVLTLRFFNKMKSEISISKSGVEIEPTADEIIMRNAETGKLIGIADKRKIDNQDSWERLTKLLC
ncbi:hypothetical protein B0I27_1145 [Arcticibacter pallidicorallinus]|uniref:PH (Pleckstrin Homology) domain-containing protein n=1 Tax=Arcticibacter pallidicorallinus TaxID=1259464 RepID=A0A2T0TS83_9SPHI|nr:hypothetical protein [Arcticibacter pallidicorallinus]PRY48546.1 hypothetical protein B0I27_1145 [Arcticibacter pallidicorallinus]